MVGLSDNKNDNEENRFKNDSKGDVAVNTCVDTGATGEPFPASQKKENYTFTKVAMALADTEYEYTIPNGVKAIHFSTLLISTMKYSFTALASGAGKTIYPGLSRQLEHQWLNSKKLYFQSSAAGNTMEIEIWT